MSDGRMILCLHTKELVLKKNILMNNVSQAPKRQNKQNESLLQVASVLNLRSRPIHHIPTSIKKLKLTLQPLDEVKESEGVKALQSEC